MVNICNNKQKSLNPPLPSVFFPADIALEPSLINQKSEGSEGHFVNSIFCRFHAVQKSITLT